MTKLNLKEIRERCEKATDGPWAADNKADFSEVSISYVERANKDEICVCVADGQDKNNAEFIAHARTDLPALLEWCERVKVVGEDMLSVRTTTGALITANKFKQLLAELEP